MAKTTTTPGLLTAQVKRELTRLRPSDWTARPIAIRYSGPAMPRNRAQPSAEQQQIEALIRDGFSNVLIMRMTGRDLPAIQAIRQSMAD
ncbi:MAG: hypothetical protein ACFB0G_01045 [Leptolyngbyaceae cyanobacterium]